MSVYINQSIARLTVCAVTTAGLSLGRVTVVDENGHTILDELVRQKVPILWVSSTPTS